MNPIRRRLTRLLPAAFAVALVPLPFSAPASAADPVTITGAGSSWIYPLLTKWAAAYEKETGARINYQSIGSGGGIAQIKAGTVDFGATDMPLPSDELERAGLIQFPTAIGGVDLVINLEGVKPGELVLDGQVVGDIFLGKITKWNDPAIAALNPGVKLPATDITVVHRSDGSGTTFTFCDYLSKVNPEWKEKVGVGTSVNWPAGVGGKGNEGVAAYVGRLPGSIGYVEYAYILENKLNYVRLVNRDGKTVSPSLQAFQAAAANVDFTKAKDFYVLLTDQPGAETWPIAGSTWQLLRKDAPAEKNREVLRFFRWGFEKGRDVAESLSYGPLPESTVKAIETYWKNKLGIEP